MIFSIVSKCESDIHKTDLFCCIDSIQKFHPNDKIVVVDSCSSDKSHFSDLEMKNVIVCDISNKNYETGGMWHVYENFYDEKYVFLQDSMYLTDSIEKYINLNFKPINFCNDWDYTKPGHRGWVREKLKTTKYKYLDDGFKMIQFNSFLISRNVLDILHQNGIGNILPTNKSESEAMERLLGIVFTHENIINNVVPFYTNSKCVGPHTDISSIKTEIVKKWRNRK
jgi:hypothetical protein